MPRNIALRRAVAAYNLRRAHIQRVQRLLALAAPEEGGGTPEWVPEGATVQIDLVNDRAWTQDDGEVEVDTLLGSDANTENYYGPSDYDAAALTADGYLSSGAISPLVAFIGTARTQLLAGATTKITYKNKTANASGALVFVGGSGDYGVYFNFGQNGVLEFLGDGDLSAMSGAVVDPDDEAVNIVAATMSPTRAEGSANGEAALNGGDPRTDDWPVSGDDVINAVLIDTVQVIALQTITIYEPVLIAALPALSAL